MAADAEKLAAQGARIKELRERTRDPDTGRRLTQDDLADAIGVTTRAVQEWESGRGDIKPERLKALADYFKVPQDFIEYGAEMRETPEPFSQPSFDKRLADLEEAVRQVDEKVDLLSAQLGARVAAVLALLEDRLPPTAESRRRRRA